MKTFSWWLHAQYILDLICSDFHSLSTRDFMAAAKDISKDWIKFCCSMHRVITSQLELFADCFAVRWYCLLKLKVLVITAPLSVDKFIFRFLDPIYRHCIIIWTEWPAKNYLNAVYVVSGNQRYLRRFNPNWPFMQSVLHCEVMC